MQISQFDSELEQFENMLIATWQTQKHQNIGLSIQSLNDTQSRVKELNETINAVNSFCSNVLNNGNLKTRKEHRLCCNRLDSELKKIVNDNGNLNGIACKCHKGISNIIIPFKYIPKDKNKPTTNWYIFYGQFLLIPIIAKTDYSAIELDISKNLLDSKNIDILQSTPSKKYVHLGPFTNKNKIQDITKESVKPISEVDVADFLSFKSFVEINFTQFLDKFKPEDLKTRDAEQTPIEKTLEKLQLASTHLETISKAKNKANDNTVVIANGILESVNSISIILESNKNNPSLKGNSDLLNRLDAFADLEDATKIETKGRQNEGESLLTELNTHVQNSTLHI